MMAPIDLLLFYLTKWKLILVQNLTVLIDLGDTDINTLNFENKEDLATHALVYYIRGAFSDLKYSSWAYLDHNWTSMTELLWENS